MPVPGPVLTPGVDLAAATKKTAVDLGLDARTVLDYDGIEGRRLLAYRETDRFTTRHTGLIPLSVSADRLAHPAMRCAVIQAKIAARHGLQARDGSDRLAEVYPAASLKVWGLPARGYKGRGAPEAQRLGLIVGQLHQAAPWLDFAGFEDRLPLPTISSTLSLPR